MIVGIVSDTHGSFAAWRAAEPLLAGARVVVHCGDVFNHGPGNPLPAGYGPRELLDALNASPVPLLPVQGNCDSDVDRKVLSFPFASPYAVLSADGLLIVASHGHHFDDGEWVELGRRWGAGLLVSGHTHRARLERREGVALLNPGSLALPRDTPCVGIVDTAERTAELRDVRDGSVYARESL